MLRSLPALLVLVASTLFVAAGLDPVARVTAQNAAPPSAAPSPPEQEATPSEVVFAFWNVENLFDTDDDPDNPGDDEYLPSNEWTPERYELKLSRLEKVLAEIEPHLLGVAEVENRAVLDALIARPKLASLGYRIAHLDSPDKRGIDLGVIYRAPFEAEAPVIHPIPIDPPTRGVLEVPMSVNGHRLTVLVNHWPSRGGGEKTVAQRALAAYVALDVVEKRVAEAEAQQHDADILLIGDFNDEPFDPSVRDHLRAIRSRNAVVNRNKPYSLYNPSWRFLGDPDVGTYYYNREWRWNVFDQAIVSRGLLDPAGVQYVEDSLSIHGPDELRDKYRRPLRFRKQGQRWHEGYSDHLLIYGKLRTAPGSTGSATGH